MEMRIVELMSAGTSPPPAVQTQAAGALQTSCKAAAAADRSAAAVSWVGRQIDWPPVAFRTRLVNGQG